MALLTKRRFSFVSKATDADSFAVVSFTGFESLSTPYRFEIVLISEKKDIDPLQVLQNTAVFTIHRDGEEDVPFYGILMQFEETQEFNGYLFFKAVLMPKLQWLSLTRHNQVFLDQPVPDILEAVLKECGLVSGIDFEFKLQNDYQPLEYVCQYGETHLNFVARWAEREGIYYFFEQTDQGEKAVFTDTKISHTDLPQGKDLFYNSRSGLDSLHTQEAVKEFLCRHTMLPQQVFLKDYNNQPNTPNT
ncbi:MAG: type VI secretion system tip protein VgrG, partial [Candidatus Electrothrix sp. EH2]|nr:type VI secretion system tip protein VgrG [Candidatus Electrothrix sp. EH2]